MADEPEQILEALDDRGITRLVVEDGAARRAGAGAGAAGQRPGAHRDLPGLFGLGASADADRRNSSPRATSRHPDPETAGAAKSEGDTGARDAIEDDGVGAGGAQPDRARRARRTREDGVPVETYRRIDLDEALARLG